MSKPETCSWGVTRGGEFEPCDKPAVAWQVDDDAPEFGAYPVCPAHTRVGRALTFDDPRRPQGDASQPCRCVWDCKHLWCGCAVHA
jgi:hypothetical protein